MAGASSSAEPSVHSISASMDSAKRRTSSGSTPERLLARLQDNPRLVLDDADAQDVAARVLERVLGIGWERHARTESAGLRRT